MAGGLGSGWRKVWGEEGGFGAGVVGRGWRAGGLLEGSSHLIPDILIVGGRTPYIAEVV